MQEVLDIRDSDRLCIKAQKPLPPGAWNGSRVRSGVKSAYVVCFIRYEMPYFYYEEGF
jgi:hypothetical protein